MAQPITFRNVTNTVTGSAASALTAAVSAFGTAGAGAGELYDKAVERTALANKELTDRTMRSIFSDGKATPEELAAVPDGADFGAIYGASQKSRETEAGLRESTADVAQSEATTELRNLQAADEQFMQSPEQRALAAEQKQTEVDTAIAKLGISQARNAREQFAFDQDVTDQQDIKKLNTGFDTDIRQYMTEYSQFAQEGLTAIANNSDMDPIARQKAIDDIVNTTARLEQRARDQRGPAYLASVRMANPGMSSYALDNSRVGKIINNNKAISQDRDQQRLTADIKAEERLDVKLDGFAAGKVDHTLGLDTETQEIIPLSGAAADANKMSNKDAYRLVKGQKDWGKIPGSEDGEIPKKFKEEIDTVLKQVGYNKELFKLVMKDVKYDSELFMEDDVNNIPSFGDIESKIRDYSLKAKQIAKANRASRAPDKSPDLATMLQEAVNSAKGE